VGRGLKERAPRLGDTVGRVLPGWLVSGMV